MKKSRPLFWFILLATLFSCAREEAPPAKQKAPVTENIEQKAEAPEASRTGAILKTETIPSSKVAIMPIACVDGSYATANYQNRHFYAAMTNMLLDVYGDIKTPRRQAILEKACDKKLIERQFYALRRKDHDLKEAGAFGREIDAEYTVLPSLKGDDSGSYEFQVRIIKTSKEENVLWDKSWSVQTQPYDYFATLKLYEDAAIATAQYFLGKKSPTWMATQGTAKAQNLLGKSLEKQKTLVLNDQIDAIRLLYSAIKEDPNYYDAWAALSETYSTLTDHLINTNTDIARDLALRAHLTSIVTLRLNAVRSESIRAALLSSYVNRNPPLMQKYRSALLEKDTQSPLTRIISSFDMDDSEKEKAFKESLSHPHYAVFLYEYMPYKMVLPIMDELFKKNRESTALCRAITNLTWNDSFNVSANYAAFYTYLAQKQFLETYMPLLGARSGKKADQMLDELRQTVPANTPEKENEKKTWDLPETMKNLEPHYANYSFIYYKDSTALKALGVCAKILDEYKAELEKDSRKKEHFFDSINFTECDEIEIWQRELLRGPLMILAVVAQNLNFKEAAPKIIPELEKMFPDDIVVLRSGFTDIYKITGFGPTGTYYLTKMNERYPDNIDVQSFVQDNYIQAQKHPHNTTYARYFTYIATDPGNSAVLTRAYNHLYRLKESDLAKKVLEFYHRQNPGDTWVKAEILRIKRLEENRFNTLEEIREVYPQNMDQLYDLWDAAAVYRANGYFDEALKLYIRANEMAPGNTRLARQLAWSWRLAGQPEKSRETQENCAVKNGDSLTACSLFTSIAYDYFFTGDIEKARYYYIKANNLDPYYGDSIIGRGYLWYADGDTQKAEEQFKMHYERYETPIGPSLICKMLLKQGKPEEALERINQYMQNQEFRNYYTPHGIKAECLYRLGRTDEAMNIIRGCADVMPSNMRARCDLAEMYLRIGKPGEAVEYLEGELKTKELGHGALSPLYCTLIYACLEKKSPYDAIPYIHKCKFHLLDNDVSLSAIGLYEFETGKIEEARKYLESAIRVNPSFTFPRATFVFLETAQGNIDRAIEIGEQGLESCVFDEDTRLYFALSEAYLKKGQTGKATNLLERVIAVDGKTSYWGTCAANLLEKIPR
ncbi:hypothetical protein JW926_05775 [Candidatus Sumerlaeota bacterium]|nr:hypothetical protein [Candidatus Sumerlaeota bacterium]